MATLWIFGDSYGADYANYTDGPKEILDAQWHRLLARELDLQYENRAFGGSSVEYSSSVWFDALRDIRPVDLVVITVTDTSRRWLLKDRPNVSNFSSLSSSDILTDLESKAVNLYFRHLYHSSDESSKLYNWICALDHIAVQRSIRTIVLPCLSSISAMIHQWQDQFSNLHIAKGSLGQVSANEHQVKLRNRPPKWCGRANHLIPINHRVLLSKLLSYYRDGVAVDLTQGFHENIINKHVLDDPDLFVWPHRF